MSLYAPSLDRADQKEVYLLLDRLSPSERIRFLRWACSTTSGDLVARVTSHSGSTWEAYQDLLLLEYQYGLDLPRAIDRLVDLVRKVR